MSSARHSLEGGALGGRADEPEEAEGAGERGGKLGRVVLAVLGVTLLTAALWRPPVRLLRAASTWSST